MQFGLRTLLVLVVFLSGACALLHNVYQHYESIRARENAVMNYLAGPHLLDYRESVGTCITKTMYERKPIHYATRMESLPWWFNPYLSPIPRFWFQRTHCLVLPTHCTTFSPDSKGTKATWDKRLQARREFYRNVAALPELEFFKPGGDFKDDDLRQFQHHPRLKFLDIRRTAVTFDGLELLERDFPALRVVVVNEPTELQQDRERWRNPSIAADAPFRLYSEGPEFWIDDRERREVRLSKWLERFNVAVEKIRRRPGLTLCLFRAVVDPTPVVVQDIPPFRSGEGLYPSPEVQAVFDRIRAEQPEAVFYDYRPRYPDY